VSSRRLAKNALFSVAQVVLSAFVLFEFYRLLTRHLGVDDIGLWSLVMASTAVARMSEFGLGGGVVKFVAGDIGAGKPGQAARTVAMAVVMVAPVVSMACIALYPALESVLGHAVPEHAIPAALALLPYALAALVAATVANVFLGALDGCQRSDLRAVVQVGAALVQLGAAYVLVPTGGIVSLGPVQLIQAGSLLLGALVLTVIQFRQPISVWVGWDNKRMREIIRYGGGIQVAAIGQLLFEPTTKALLTMFGGLALTGYYEMANRMMLQFRAVIVSAFNTLVPYVAGRMGQTPASVDADEVRGIYLGAYRLLLVLAVPYYGLIGTVLPILLTFWLGRFEPQFLAVAMLCWLGWVFNTMVGPAYFLYLAIGRLRWTIWTQFAIGSLNALLAVVGGWLWGGYGVLVGSTLALAIGSYVAVIAFHIEYRVPARELLPRQSVALVFACVIGMVLVHGFAYGWRGAEGWLVVLASMLLLLAAVMARLVWRHPQRIVLLQLLPQWRRAP
jgi:O-antigen/teichoic acid export membrane protein